MVRRSVERIIRDAVPALADFCLVHVRQEHSLRAVAGVHATPDGTRDLHGLMRARIRLDDLRSTAAHVVRTGRTVLRADIHRGRTDRDTTDRVERLVNRLAPRSALVLPLVSGNTVFGTVSLCYSLSRRSYAPRHLSAARRLAARVAEALAATPLSLATTTAAAAVRPHASVRRRLPAR